MSSIVSQSVICDQFHFGADTPMADTRLIIIYIASKASIQEFRNIRKDVNKGFVTYTHSSGCILWKYTFRIEGSKEHIRKELPKLKEALLLLYLNDTEAVRLLNSDNYFGDIARMRIVFDTTSADIKFNF